jgi:plastocyanin
MRFSTFAAVLASISAATAQQTWDVIVGGNETLTFSPNVVNASIGDTVAFTLCVSLDHFQ